METPHRRKVREFLAREPFCKRNISESQLDVLCDALTHNSYSHEAGIKASYQRLEFLGDAVIELIVREYFYLKTKGNEGNMTIMKQDIVANREIASKVQLKGLGLDDVMLLGNGFVDTKTKENKPVEKIRADCFEALIGAFYLVFGLEDSRNIVEKILL